MKYHTVSVPLHLLDDLDLLVADAKRRRHRPLGSSPSRGTVTAELISAAAEKLATKQDAKADDPLTMVLTELIDIGDATPSRLATLVKTRRSLAKALDALGMREPEPRSISRLLVRWSNLIVKLGDDDWVVGRRSTPSGCSFMALNLTKPKRRGVCPVCGFVRAVHVGKIGPHKVPRRGTESDRGTDCNGVGQPSWNPGKTTT